ncbi:transducin family protein [Actinidia rufa]|uniref:Transducin family protein n=1 Tax=Actinidia rufa TaxID=165716 RepID=A0A7J0FLZ5_9ERIC|nr:transducin family protein [Actinidia rufa]
MSHTTVTTTSPSLDNRLLKYTHQPPTNNSQSLTSLGAFQVESSYYGKRIRDPMLLLNSLSFCGVQLKLPAVRWNKPKWPTSSFVSSDGLITAMAYRLPHVVMGDRSGNIRWWDVTTGQSSSFNTHREGIRRIKFSPVVPGDRSRGRIAVLFYDNTFSVFDLDSPDPLANSLLQPQFPGTLVLELDWLPLRTDKNDPLVLCIAGADSSFRLVEALRMILQLGVKPAWFNTCSTTIEKRHGTAASTGDLRSYMIDSPPVGDSVVPELLLKVLEPYRIEGCILDDERARLYASVVDKGCTARFAFAAAIFGESTEALFWLQLPHALNHLMSKLAYKSPQKTPGPASEPELDESAMLSRITSKGKSMSETGKTDVLSNGQLRLMAFEREELWGSANERIPWHEKLNSEEAIQNRVHEDSKTLDRVDVEEASVVNSGLVSVGNLEAAVSLLLSTHPESSYFYANALRAVALSSAVSRSLLELAVKVVAANMVRTDRSLSGTHLLCAVGRYQEACSQLQDAGCWRDAATLAASHLKGSDYARALILYVAAGALQEALAALREAQQPDTAAMFVLACREIHADITASTLETNEESRSLVKDKLPWLNPENEDVIAVGEYFEQYQRKLVHLCMDSQPFSD